jgi:GNAT superfamily N-acetyltransferase
MASQEVRVIPVQTKQEMKQFVDFPYKIYRKDPYWVPTLRMDRAALFDPKKFPYFEHADVQLFLALRGGEPVGTICAHVNHRHNEFHEEKAGFFGFFETVDDYAVAEKLLHAATEWVRARGMTVIRGPMNYSGNEDCGLLVDGFDSSPVVMMTYNPRYYAGFIDRAGFAKAQDLYAYWLDTGEVVTKDGKVLNPKLVRVVEKVRERAGVTIRKVNMKDFDNEVVRIKKVYNSAWERNWGFVPMTDAEFAHLAESLKMVLDPNLVLLAEIDGEPVGFSLTLPDVNQALKGTGGHLIPAIVRLLWYKAFHKFTICRVIAMGVVEQHRMKGIAAVFYYETALNAAPRGYAHAEMSWILESNLMMNRDTQFMGGKVYKTYRVYEKAL